MDEKKIFILGSNGQLGSYLCQNLKSNNYKIKIYKSKNYKINLKNFFRSAKKLKKLKPDMIINCSAYTDVDKSELEKKTAKKLNHEYVRILKNYCELNSIILIHFSTDYVFSNKKKFYEPSDSCKPINYYGYTKYLGEKELQKSKGKFFIFRISWLLSSQKKNFIMRIRSKIKKGEKFNVIYDAYSSPTSVIFINNFLKKNLKLLFNSNLSGIFHLTSPVVLSYFKLAKYIEKISFKKNYNIVQKEKFNNYVTIAKRPQVSKLGLKKTKKYFLLPKNSWKNDIKKLIK